MHESWLVRASFLLAFSAAATAKPQVLASVGMAADTVQQIAGAHVVVEALMGPGTDPHLYRATAHDLTRLRRADLIVSVGLHLEGKIENALRMKGKKIVVLGDHMPAAQLLDGGALGLHDPHVWFDPELWTTSAHAIVEVLGELAPAGRAEYAANYERWRTSVLTESTRWKARIATLPKSQRILVTSHDAFRYFGRYFGFEVEGLQGVSTESEAGIKRMKELIALVKERKVPALFAESSVPPAGIERLQAATGVRRGRELFSDALGPPGSGAETYLGMLTKNLAAVYEGLGGQP